MGGGGGGKTGGEEERASPARFALQPDPASHHFHQLAADGEAKSGAAVFAAGGPIGLVKRLENMVVQMLRNANAGVGDGETKDDVRTGGGFEPHRDFNRAGLREFEGVSGEVRQHLAQADGISGNHTWDIGRDGRIHFDALTAGRVAERGDRLFETSGGGEILRVKLELSGLDLGNVEDVVQQPEERLRRVVARFEEAALLLAQRGRQGEMNHAQHAVHGRTDLVAHIGEKFALVTAGFLQRASAFLHHPFELFLTGEGGAQTPAPGNAHQSPAEAQNGREQRQTEPPGLPPVGCDGEGRQRGLRAPMPQGIAGAYLEGEMSGGKIGIPGVASGRFDPIRLQIL